MSKPIHTALCTIIIFFCSTLLSADQYYCDKEGNLIRIAPVKSIEEIPQAKSQDILVRSFMDAYEDVPLVDLNPEFRSTGDVRRFYQSYFHEEFHEMQEGHIFWVQAFVNDELAGWATFMLETNEENAAYMNLLVVAPEHQGKGIGKHLTFSICSVDLFPAVRAINLLIRKVNTEGYSFYRNIGFFDFDYQRDNFVDPSLLSGLRWEREKK